MVPAMGSTVEAKTRIDLGNPPGKKKSLGDAVNWEILKDEVPLGEDLYFVGEDVDFYSDLYKDNFKEMLIDEWQNDKKSTIFCYKRLAHFLRIISQTLN